MGTWLVYARPGRLLEFKLGHRKTAIYTSTPPSVAYVVAASRGIIPGKPKESARVVLWKLPEISQVVGLVGETYLPPVGIPDNRPCLLLS